MPVVYAWTKKGKLESLLRRSEVALSKKEMIQEMKNLGVEISRSSVNSAIEEWETNNLLVKNDDKYKWKVNR
jgi:hypothetical protein